MLIVMTPGASQKQVDVVRIYIEKKGFDAHIVYGELQTVIGAVGGKIIDPRDIELFEGVKEVINVLPAGLRHGYTCSGQSECTDKVVKTIWVK